MFYAEVNMVSLAYVSNMLSYFWNTRPELNNSDLIKRRSQLTLFNSDMLAIL